ncbi:MAG: ATP-dependent protease subunit HslV [Pseudomonadota bacterium]
MTEMRGTTILAVRHGGKVVLCGDGQITFGDTVMKHGAKKLRRLFNDRVLVGFAGSTADALNLFERFEGKLEQFSGNLTRSAVELAKDWRTDRVLRRLDALLIAVDADKSFIISGAGEVLEPDDGILAIGSGGPYALAAARGMLAAAPQLSAREVTQQAMAIAAQICIFTNSEVSTEEL